MVNIHLEPKWGPLFWLEVQPCFGGQVPSKIEVTQGWPRQFYKAVETNLLHLDAIQNSRARSSPASTKLAKRGNCKDEFASACAMRLSRWWIHHGKQRWDDDQSFNRLNGRVSPECVFGQNLGRGFVVVVFVFVGGLGWRCSSRFMIYRLHSQEKNIKVPCNRM